MDFLKGLTDLEQLGYVESFLDYKPYYNSDGSSRLGTMEDFYMAIHWPVGVGKPSDYVLYSEADGPRRYELNKSLDIDGDKKITKSEAAKKSKRFL